MRGLTVCCVLALSKAAAGGVIQFSDRLENWGRGATPRFTFAL
jgi:hypothetical protein